MNSIFWSQKRKTAKLREILAQKQFKKIGQRKKEFLLFSRCSVVMATTSTRSNSLNGNAVT